MTRTFSDGTARVIISPRCRSYLPDAIAQEGFALLEGYTARFASSGEGPPVILLPGLAGGIGLLRPLAEQLARSFTVIRYELRGEDDCFSLRRRFRVDDLVGDLEQFVLQQRLERPILFGVSFGGAIAVEYAARHPSRVGALILQGTDVRFPRSMLRQVAGHVLSGYPLPADSAFVNQFFNLLLGESSRNHPLFGFITSQCWQTDQGVMAYRFRLAERVDLRPVLPAVQAPTLLINGDQDVLVTEEGLGAYRQAMASVEFVELTGAGHLAFVTHAAETARAADGFARRLGLLEWEN